jgi:gluconate 2-dehydrogenase gamma chain
MRQESVVPDGERGDGSLVSRREVLQRGAVAGAVIVVPSFLAACGGSASTRPHPSAVLEAIVERLVPADASGPGGKEAGAALYIERSLKGGLAGGLSDAAGLYSAGLAAVDRYAKSKYGSAFTALAPGKQDAVLSDMELGKATGFTPDSATFFAAIREHTLQGMFSDPVYGGNKAFAGWDLLGYPGVSMPAAAGNQRLGVQVTAAHQSTYAQGQFPQAMKEALA